MTAWLVTWLCMLVIWVQWQFLCGLSSKPPLASSSILGSDSRASKSADVTLTSGACSHFANSHSVTLALAVEPVRKVFVQLMSEPGSMRLRARNGSSNA